MRFVLWVSIKDHSGGTQTGPESLSVSTHCWSSLNRDVALVTKEIVLCIEQRGLTSMRCVSPGLGDLACFAQADEHVFVKTFISQPAVEALDESILDRLAGLDVVPGDSVDGRAQQRTACLRGASQVEGREMGAFKDLG